MRVNYCILIQKKQENYGLGSRREMEKDSEATPIKAFPAWAEPDQVYYSFCSNDGFQVSNYSCSPISAGGDQGVQVIYNLNKTGGGSDGGAGASGPQPHICEVSGSKPEGGVWSLL